MSIIEISNLRKKYDTVTALEDLSLSVKQGEIYGLLGPNGSGKSTTMRCLLSLVKPTSGSIKLFDKELHKNRRAVLSKIGYLIEKPDFYGYLSAKRNLQLLAAYCDKPISELRIDEVLEQVGLKGREKDLVKTYSHGMKQRLGLAQVIMHQPELVILDEPNTGLDPSGIIDLRVFIQQLKAEGKTIVLSSDIQPKKFIMFTDGYPFGSWGEPDYCDTMFVIHGSTTIEAPFGITTYYELSREHA
jgi:ABC-2 type transport system ATP-binding protein